jgi:hypothetical protein
MIAVTKNQESGALWANQEPDAAHRFSVRPEGTRFLVLKYQELRMTNPTQDRLFDHAQR